MRISYVRFLNYCHYSKSHDNFDSSGSTSSSSIISSGVSLINFILSASVSGSTSPINTIVSPRTIYRPSGTSQNRPGKRTLSHVSSRIKFINWSKLLRRPTKWRPSRRMIMTRLSISSIKLAAPGKYILLLSPPLVSVVDVVA
jgi:hypothetical protein